MNINSTSSIANNTNFKGAFVVSKATPQIKQEFQKYATEGCKVFYNFSKKGDALLFAHDRLNKDIEAFLKKVCDRFKFWGNFTPNNYRDINWVKTVIDHSCFVGAVNKSFSVWDCIKSKLRCLEAIGLKVDIDNAKLSMYKGVTCIDDVTNERKILMSPQLYHKSYGQEMNYRELRDDVYIKVYPYSSSKNAEYLKCENQEIINDNYPAKIVKRYETPDEMLEFNKLFNSAKRNYDPDFMSKYPQGRTNMELMIETLSSDREDVFKRIVEKNSINAKNFCYDATFVPTLAAARILRGHLYYNDDLILYNRYLRKK